MKRLFKVDDLMKTATVQMRSGKGDGRAITVESGISGDRLGIRIERKIIASDVANGRLKPLAIEEVKHRGGKRSVQLVLEYESAKALYRALRPVLKQARRQRLFFYLPQLLLGVLVDQRKISG